MTHTPEPWNADGYRIEAYRGFSEEDRADYWQVVGEAEDVADAARIAACVNACAGLDTAALAAAPVGALAKVVEAAEAMDPRRIGSGPSTDLIALHAASMALRAALAALRGGAQ